MTRHAHAPFTDSQVASIAEYQASDTFHPFTCPRGHDGERVLYPSHSGLECPELACDYWQTWVHDWMADWEWKKLLDKEEPK